MPLPRHPLRFAQTQIQIPFSHGSVSATTVVKLWKTAADRSIRIDRVFYNNPTGLAADATNYFDVQVLNAATVAAKWSTLTGSDGAIGANTPLDLALQSAAARTLPVATVLSLSLVLTGTQTLPAGIGLIEATVL